MKNPITVSYGQRIGWRVLFMWCAWAIPAAATAQVARYTFAQSTRAYVPLTGGTVLATAMPNYAPGPGALSGTVHPLPSNAIPFSFAFNGASYATAYVASGGYLTLGTLAPVPRFTRKPGSSNDVYDIDHPLSEPDGTGYDGVIAPMAGDILANVDPANLGELRYQTLGAAPNRVFVVQWAHMRVYGTTSELNFQVRLLEAGNAVELAYGPNQASLNTSGQTMLTQVGLRGSTPNDFNNRTGTWAASTAGTANTDGLTVGPGSVPANGLVYGFTPGAVQPCPQPFSLTATPAGTRAVLHWRAAAPSAGPYSVVYGLAGFNPAVPAQVLGTQTATGTSSTVTGLTPTTNYEFYVTQQCGGSAGTSPASSPPGRFRTTILNDEAVDAVSLPVNATCQPLSTTLAGATRSIGNGYNPLQSCNGNLGTAEDADVWFTVTTAASGPASTAMQITPGGSTAVEVRVLSSANGAAGPFTQLYCQANPSNSGLFTPFTLAGLTPNTTYFLLITNSIELNPKGQFTLCATVPPACGTPTNVLSNFTNSTTTTAQLSFMAGSGATNYTVTLTPTAPTTGPAQTVTPPPTSSPVTIANLTPATNYAGTLQANCPGGGVSAAVPFTAYTRVVNDEPSTAIPLLVGTTCQPITGSTLNATGSSSRIGFPSGYSGTGCGTQRPYDVWYTFTTPATGLASRAVRITVTGTGGQQVRVFTAPSVTGPFGELACSAGSTTTAAPLLDLTGLSASTTYYVLVGTYGFPINAGPFTICVTEPPTCGTPQGANVSGITATSAQVFFAPGVPPATNGYTVTLTAQGQAPTTLANPGTNGVIPLTGLTSGTFYTVALQANCGTGGLSLPATLNFLTLGTPANDLCTNAQVVHCGDGPVLGVVTGATATGQPGAACGGSAPLGPGVWYRLAGTGQTVTLSFCSGYGDDPDLQLLVYSGSCGNLTCVGSNDNSTTCSYVRLPALTFPTVAGTGLLRPGRGHRPAHCGAAE